MWIQEWSKFLYTVTMSSAGHAIFWLSKVQTFGLCKKWCIVIKKEKKCVHNFMALGFLHHIITALFSVQGAK